MAERNKLPQRKSREMGPWDKAQLPVGGPPPRKWEDPNYSDTHDIFEIVGQMFGDKGREQLDQEIDFDELRRPENIKDPKKKARVMRSYEANNDPYPEGGEGMFESAQGRRRMRAIRRASVKGRPGMKPSSKDIEPGDPAYDYYAWIDRDMNAGPYPEASTRPKNMGSTGTTRKKAAQAFYKKYNSGK